MSENITFPNNPPQAGDQFTIGNTTYAWDTAPGIWRAFVTATSSSGAGSGDPWPVQWVNRNVNTGTGLTQVLGLRVQNGTPLTNTFTIEHSGRYYIALYGAGGSATLARGSSTNYASGGSGSVTFGQYDFAAGDTISYTLSPSGATTLAGGSSFRQPNTTPSDSTAAFGDVTLTAPGGGSASLATPGTAAAPATGGQYNFTGTVGTLVSVQNGLTLAFPDFGFLNTEFGVGIDGNSDAPAGFSITGGGSALDVVLISPTPDAGATGGGGGSTTINIGGGGAGLQLGETAMDNITTSRTIAAGDLTGTGPAWVMLAGGGGGGSTAIFNSLNTAGSAGSGGAGGNYGFFLSDASTLVGATFTAGTAGQGNTITRNVSDGTTVVFGTDGTAGTTSTLVLDGTTYTCTGGGGGARGAPGTTGAAGTATATGGTPLDLLDVATANTDIDTYWNGFIVTVSGVLRVGGSVVDIAGSSGGPGGAASAAVSSGASPPLTATSFNGSAGMLQIVYQNQA